ncbi:unannotated protein [freshwater metagenome]|uniref:Unannotated protein n=1 Tax=freshwater metagenome TaxID=449393 RepID=A0A6J7J8K2_9ZZZZ
MHEVHRSTSPTRSSEDFHHRLLLGLCGPARRHPSGVNAPLLSGRRLGGLDRIVFLGVNVGEPRDSAEGPHDRLDGLDAHHQLTAIGGEEFDRAHATLDERRHHVVDVRGMAVEHPMKGVVTARLNGHRQLLIERSNRVLSDHRNREVDHRRGAARESRQRRALEGVEREKGTEGNRKMAVRVDASRQHVLAARVDDSGRS